MQLTGRHHPWLLYLLSLSLSSCCAHQQADKSKATQAAGATPTASSSATALERPGPGRLPLAIRPSSYDLDLKVDPRQERFSGEVRIHLQLDQPSAEIFFHGVDMEFLEASCHVGERSLAATISSASTAGSDAHEGEHVARCAETLPAGPASLFIRYSSPFDTKLAGLYRAQGGGNWYAYTQFEAADARKAFPCLDEPGWKIPFRLTLRVPAEMSAIANTPVESSQTEAGTKVVRFSETRPLPTYLVAIVVGPVDIVEGSHSSIPIRGLTTQGKGPMVKEALQMTSELLKVLEDYFGRPYPYRKLDSAALLEFGAGAMENAGLITYREEILLIDPATTSTSRRRAIAGTVAHELAHQWFGNLVTMRWWDDLWLNEAFATWMSAKAIDTWRPHYDAAMRLLKGRMWVFSLDALKAARAVRQPVATVAEAESAFDGLTYVKGANVLWMLERWVGETAFRDGVRAYLNAHAFGNASAEDLFSALDKSSGKPVGSVARSFLDRPGVPLVRTKLSCSENAAPKLTLTQQRYRPLGSAAEAGFPNAKAWEIPICVAYPRGTPQGSGSEQVVRSCTLLEGPEKTIELEGSSCPAWLHPNADEDGYYRWALGATELEALVKGAQALDQRVQVALLAQSWAMVQAGQLPPSSYIAALDAFKNQTKRAVVEELVAGVNRIGGSWEAIGRSPEFHSFARSLLEPAAKKLGWAPSAGESEELTLLRPSLLRTLGKYGRPQWLLDGAQKAAADYLKDPAALTPDVAPIALWIATREGHVGFEALTNSLKNAPSPAVRVNALRALGALPVKDGQLAKALALLLTEEIRVQDLGRVFYSALRDSPQSREHTFDFLTKHFDQLTQRLPSFGWGSKARLPNVIRYFCSREGQKKASDFFVKKKVEGGERWMEQGLERADQCIALEEAGRDDLTKLLKPTQP